MRSLEVVYSDRERFLFIEKKCLFDFVMFLLFYVKIYSYIFVIVF